MILMNKIARVYVHTWIFVQRTDWSNEYVLARVSTNRFAIKSPLLITRNTDWITESPSYARNHPPPPPPATLARWSTCVATVLVRSRRDASAAS